MHKIALIFLYTIFCFGRPLIAHSNEYSQSSNDDNLLNFEFKDKQNGSMYTFSEAQSFDENLRGNPLDRSDSLISSKEINPKSKITGDSHSDHINIKISKHEWVSTSQKGYGAAAGITLIAGLVFGILLLRRI